MRLSRKDKAIILPALERYLKSFTVDGREELQEDGIGICSEERFKEIEETIERVKKADTR